MKCGLDVPRVLIVTFGFVVAAPGLGQTTRVWTNQFPSHATGAGDLGTATNWDPNGVPVPANGPDSGGFYGDELWFDGRTTGDLALTTDTGLTSFSGGPWGLRVHLTSNQVNAVNLYTRALISAGTRMQSFTIDSGAGAFSLGNDSLTNALDMIMGGVGGQVHNFINNSSNPAVIFPNARWRFGGGGAHTFVFDGSGNWVVSNTLLTVANSPTVITKQGSGTMSWTWVVHPLAGPNSFFQGPLTINGGTLIMKSSGLFPTAVQTIVLNEGLLKYDGASESQTFAGIISGPAPIEVGNGTLTLSGQSTFSGNITLSGGELVAGSVETFGVSGPLGVGGAISFSGGTLVFSANNTFDYSPRFSTAAGQAYRLDTAGQTVTFTNNLASSGATLNKLGNGTLLLTGTSSYIGLTTVSQGTLALQGPKIGSGNITVADGAALVVFNNSTQVTPNTLSLGTSLGASLEFDNVSSTTTAPLKPNAIASAGPVTININSGTFDVGNSYPLLEWTSGSAPAVSLGSVNDGSGYLSTNGSTIQFNVTGVPLTWNGTNGSDWNATGNWTMAGFPSDFVPLSHVIFNDAAAGTTSVIVDAPVQPESITISNSAKTYSIASGGGNNIAGSTGLNKSGSGTLTLAGGANTYTGGTTISGGTIIVSTLTDGGLASDIGAASSAAANLMLDGGILRYTGGVTSSDRLFSLGSKGGVIDASGSGTLLLTNSGTLDGLGNILRTLTLTGVNVDSNTLAAAIGDSPAGGATLVAKSGAGTWVLTGTNTYRGGTTISDGVLQIGAAGGAGSLGGGNITNHGMLVFNRTGQLTVSGAISGTGPVTINGSGTVTLTGDNTYTGGTTINTGTLQIGNGGATGKLDANSGVVNNGSLIFNSSSPFTLNGVISGAGSVTKFGSGILTLTAANTYSGNTSVSGGTLVIIGVTSAGMSQLFSGALLINGEGYSPIVAFGGNLGGTGVLHAPVTISSGGGLAPGQVGSVGTLTISTNLIFGGRLVIDVNKSLSPSNDFVVVSGALTNTGSGAPGMGTLTVSNLGPALAVGDRFTLFSKPMQNGAAVTISGAGATWVNHLAMDGSISVTAVTRPTLNFTNPGNTLQFSWNSSYGAYRLQLQTNSASAGLGTNWVDYPGGGVSPVTVPLDPATGTVFFRLISTL